MVIRLWWTASVPKWDKMGMINTTAIDKWAYYTYKFKHTTIWTPTRMASEFSHPPQQNRKKQHGEWIYRYSIPWYMGCIFWGEPRDIFQDRPCIHQGLRFETWKDLLPLKAPQHQSLRSRVAANDLVPGSIAGFGKPINKQIFKK